MADQAPIPIAIIGVGCRFPGGANDTEKLWSLLAEGRSAWTDVPKDRFNWEAFYHPNADVNGTLNHRGGHFLDQDIRAFDAEFFGISPVEAQAIDPQHRIQLETAYEALENAGIPIGSVRGTDTAVYVAVFSRDYDRIQYSDPQNFAQYTMLGTGDAIASNRISYVFDLKGPSITLDTGCSGSLVALHQACQSLRTKESGMALVGGTNLILSPDAMIPMSLLHILNPDGKCYSFDSRGSGYGRGEGVATVVLKRLDDALSAGDPVRAVICQTGVNQDGRTKGITLPSQTAQQSLMGQVYRSAGIEPQDIGYFETHGTGTVAGDRIEVEAIESIFCTQQPRDSPLFLGSIKANIGHCESSSGIAGLIKAALVLQKGQIPPNVNLKTLKTELNFDKVTLEVPTELLKWPATATRRASVNSFGYGGTNAHAVLEQAPKSLVSHVAHGYGVNGVSSVCSREPQVPERVSDRISSTNGMHLESPESKAKLSEDLAVNGAEVLRSHCGGLANSNPFGRRKEQPQLLVLSARSQTSLKQAIGEFTNWVSKHKMNEKESIEDLAYTLSCRRSLFAWRCSLLVMNFEELARNLKIEPPQPHKSSSNVQITFVFTGQGSQWFAMGRELNQTSSTFRNSLDQSDKVLQLLGAEWSLSNELSKSEAESCVNESQIAQPGTTAIQIALVDLLHSLSIKPSIVLGHSSGEIAAAYAAGILTRSDALRVAYQRGFASKLSALVVTSRGAMLAVGLGEAQILAHLDPMQSKRVSIACVNSPSSVTVSGDETCIDELKDRLDGLSIFNRKLLVDTAYHSHHMSKIADKYQESLQHLRWTDATPGIKFISTVTASEKKSSFGPSYWTENLVSTVRFSDALEAICRDSSAFKSPSCTRAFLEIGPHSALSGPIRQTIAGLQSRAIQYFYASALVRKHDAVRTVLELTASLFHYGYGVDINSANCLSDSSQASRRTVSDLPPYSWDHSTTFWHESPLSEAHRFRAHPWHDLLGVRIPGSSIHEPVWRNLVGTDDLPWLKDHIADGLSVFPGAGYLCSAIEAMRQISVDCGASAPIRRFIMKDVHFLKALVIPESPAKAEIKFSLRLNQATGSVSTDWKQFQVECRTLDGIWHSHCRGFVRVEHQQPLDEVELDREDRLVLTTQREKLKCRKARCTKDIDVKDLYAILKANGNEYRSNFSILQDLRTSGSEAVGSIRIPDIAECMPSKFMRPHLIHPATLDSLFHINIPLFHECCSLGPAIPVSIEEVVVSAQIAQKPGTELILTTKLSPEDSRSARVNVMAFQYNGDLNTESMISMTNIELRGVGEIQKALGSRSTTPNMIHRHVWDVDVEALRAEDIQLSKGNPTLGTTNASGMAPDERSDTLNRAASYYIQSCLDHLAGGESHIPAKHHGYLMAWMERYVKSCEHLQHLDDVVSRTGDHISQQVSNVGAQGEMLSRTGENLHLLLTGKLDPLALMLEDGLLYRIYAEDSSLQSGLHLAAFVRRLLFKSPYLTVLEIGAGTGGTTLPLFQALGQTGGSSFRRYDFTDVSSGFFEPAKDLLHQWAHILDFKKLDIEQDPVAQGFTAHSYDLIIAANVLHATSPINRTLEHIRKLLKPTGRLAVIEVTKPPPYANITFGLLPGWWKSFDEDHQDGPLLSASEWNDKLRHNHFSGTDVVVKDYESSAHECSLLISRPVEQKPQRRPALIEIRALGFHHLPLQLQAFLQKEGYTCKHASWDFSQVSTDVTYIILDAGGRPVLEDPSEGEFTGVTSLLTQARRILWVSVDQDGSPDVKPERGLIEGLARVARAENKTLELVTMSIVQATKDNLSSSLEAICQVFGRSFGDDSPPNELEYRKVGELKVQRLLPDTNIQHFVNSDHQSQPMQALFHQQIRPLKLHVANPGLLDSMIFVDDDVARTDLCPDEVEIKARAYGINFKDVFIALGQMREQEMTGECAGIVTRVGSSLPSQFKVGDRVCGWRGTPYASHPRFKATNVSHIPDSMSFETAASLPVVYMTAYYSLVEVARLSKGDKVLIHAASGGVGQAAVQIAQTYEAEIFATVGSVAKKELVKEKYGILDSHIFSSRARTFKSGIMRLTQGEGVDVVLNSLSGDYLQETWDCIAMFGTFIEIGKTDIYRNQQIHMKPFDRNVNFSSVDLVLLADHKPHAMKKVFGEIMLMFQTGRLKPVHPVTIVPIGEAVDTFRLIQARKHVGKLVLQATETAMVKATALKREPFVLNGNATYLIAGGRGSLGRSIVRYMIDHGAKHLVIFSRRDMKSHEELLFVQDVKSSDVEILLMTCDITSAASVKQAVMSIERSMPPIKGVVQAAMVLQDQLLERMSVDAYKQALRPKMLGTRNLVDALVDNVFDFFIMLSSASSIIGLSGQANYAAGCAYQDALAQSCSYTNAHYVSLNLGMVEETDIIASRPEFRQAWLRAGFIPIAVQDVLNLLEYAMSGQARKDDCRQISIGFNIESLSQPSASDVLKNPIFCHLPLSSDTTKAKPGLQTQLDVSDALLAAKSTEEIHTITASAISKKMAALISLGEEGIGVEVPISSLGLDSLIAIELKNWIVQTFHSPLQTSEILDSPNIISLAGTVAKRSTVLSNKMETSLTEASQAVPDQSQDSSHQRLPTIPLPNLTDSLNQYIESVQSFCSAEDMESLLAAMNRFQGPDGRGQELHQRLLARMKDPTLDDWLYDLYQHETWTKRRVPLNPYGHFFGALRSSDVKHSQAQWAAIITEAAFRFKQRLQAGDIDRDYMNEQPLDMNLHNWTFNTWLEAGTENDKIRKEGIDNHIIVLRNGHIFRVVLDRALSSPSDLEAQFENILNASNSVVPSLATLTADGRESWAGIRKIVAVADPKNESLLQLIETSAFVVCLDDFSPSTSSERVNCFLLGGPSNRWSDKSLQFVVCSNGASAGIAEHAMLDGDTLNQLWDAINLAISNKGVEGRVEANSRSKEDVQELEEYSFHITPEIEGHINRVHDLFYKDFTEYEYTHHTLSTLGSSLLRAHKLAPKVVFQIIIQLAGRLYFGESHPCLEPVSMRPFHKGRLDFIQTTIPPVFDFLVSAATALERHRQSGSQTQPSTDNTRSPLTPAAEDLNLRTRLLDAAKALSNLITNTTRGRGFRNHFLALRAMVRPEEGEEMPDFFKHPSFGLIGPGRISTDCLSRHGKVTEAGFHRPGPWKVWVHYEVGDEGCQFAIKAPSRGRTQAFFEVVERAAGFVRGLLERGEGGEAMQLNA